MITDFFLFLQKCLLDMRIFVLTLKFIFNQSKTNKFESYCFGTICPISHISSSIVHNTSKALDHKCGKCLFNKLHIHISLGFSTL